MYDINAWLMILYGNALKIRKKGIVNGQELNVTDRTGLCLIRHTENKS